MSERSQQQTLSVRISEEMRRRLERIRTRTASQTGQPASMSDIAKRLLESARGHSVEVCDLLAEPTRVMLQMRRKRDVGSSLTPEEWTVLAYFVQRGMESVNHASTPAWRMTIASVLDAFLEVYELRGGWQWNAQYLENLPNEGRASGHGHARDDASNVAQVRHAVRETRRRLANDDVGMPLQQVRAGRSLHILLDEGLVGAETLNRVLPRYWPALWPLAARGHFVATGRPVRSESVPYPEVDEFVVSAATEGRTALSLTCRDEVMAVVAFQGVIYPVMRYPELREFRMMVAELGETRREWEGPYFRGYVDGDGVRFRAHTNGVTVGCRLEEWGRLRTLCVTGWERVEIRQAWERLAIEYGEV
jgi:hypothetical protein